VADAAVALALAAVAAVALAFAVVAAAVDFAVEAAGVVILAVVFALVADGVALPLSHPAAKAINIAAADTAAMTFFRFLFILICPSFLM